MSSVKNKVVFTVLTAIALMTAAVAKYDIYPDTVAIGDVVKPEDGLAFVVQTTTGASVPCPKMTEVQRDALVDLAAGFCIYNTTAAETQFYNGAIWSSAGGGAVLSAWTTGVDYGIGDFVYTTDFKLWISNATHTSGATFAGDIANWDEASDGMDRLGASTDNAIVRFDGVTGDLVQDSSVLIDDTNNVSGIADLTATGTTTLATALTGVAHLSSGVVSASNVDLTSEVTGTLPIANGGTNSSSALANNLVMVSSAGAIVESATTATELSYLDATSSIQTQLNAKLETVDLAADVGATILPIANGGTGSATQNFVDLTTTQSITGAKTFDLLTANGRISQTGLGDSTMLGFNAGAADDLTTNANVYVGSQAGLGGVGAQHNVAIGESALKSNIGGANNTAVGWQALLTNTTNSNTGIGSYALVLLNNGQHNTAVGVNANYLSVSGGYNVSVGNNSNGTTTGSFNTGVGYMAEGNQTSGQYNTSLGYNAGKGASGARSNNIFIGANTGTTVSTGSSNLLLGYNLSLPTATTSNHLNIAGALTGDISTGDLTLAGTGALTLNSGTTAQRPGTPVAGMTRFNSDTSIVEAYNGSLWSAVGGSPVLTTVTKTTATLATSGEDNVVCDTSGGAVTLTLPAASGNSGLTYRITNNSSSNDCTIDGNASETISGFTTVDLQKLGDSAILMCDGSNWHLISKSALGGAINSTVDGTPEYITVESCSITADTGTPVSDSTTTLCGSWISSITDNGVGNYTLNFVTGIFSQPPGCNITIRAGGNGNYSCHASSNPSTSNQSVRCQVAGAAGDYNFNITCVGVR